MWMCSGDAAVGRSFARLAAVSWNGVRGCIRQRPPPQLRGHHRCRGFFFFFFSTHLKLRVAGLGLAGDSLHEGQHGLAHLGHA